MKIINNLRIPKEIMDKVINPGKSYNSYDNKAPKDWDVDNFVGYVRDRMDSNNIISLCTPLLMFLFKENISIDMLNKGSRLNKNKNFNKYHNWCSALYDIWETVLKIYALEYIPKKWIKENKLKLTDAKLLLEAYRRYHMFGIEENKSLSEAWTGLGGSIYNKSEYFKRVNSNSDPRYTNWYQLTQSGVQLVEKLISDLPWDEDYNSELFTGIL
jgi:hypothetical protein